MARWLLGVLVLVVAAACAQSGDGAATSDETSASASNSDDGSAFVEVEGPLIGLAITTSIDEQGRAIDPTQRFAATAPQITAAAFTGSGEGDLVFEWFQVEAGDGEGGAGAERVKLFEHRVAVGPLDHAFSVGSNPGTLAVGSYAVVASLGGASTEAAFEVADADGGTASANSGQAAQAARPPLPGESGLGSPATEADPEQPTSVFFLSGDTVVHRGPVLPTLLMIWWPTVGDRDVVAEATVTAGGAPARQRLELAAGATSLKKESELDPCRLASGSDLPGTRLTLSNRFVSGGPGAVDMWPEGGSVTLGPDKTVPVFTTFDASVPPGTRVKPGDTIGVEVIARDQKRKGATWQTGVKLLEVRANGEVVEEPVYGPRLPTPCDDAGRVLDLSVKYRVPRNPPPIIRLCAQAEDYKENIGERCYSYPTEDSWTGTYTGTATWDCSSYGRRPGKLEGSYTIVVAADATATLAGTNTVTGSCSGPNVGTLTTPITITGRRTETAFEFPASLFRLPGSFTITVTGERGTGALSGTTADGVPIELAFEIQLAPALPPAV